MKKVLNCEINYINGQMFSEIKRMSFRHKNNKFSYYLKNYLRYYVFNKKNLDKFYKTKEFLSDREDYEYIIKRLNYYNKLENIRVLSDDKLFLSEFKLKDHPKVYFFDLFEYARYFDSKLCIIPLLGDITHVPDYPSIVKSRPISADNEASVVMKLEKLRHFLFINDPISFKDKNHAALFRGKAQGKAHRLNLLERFYNKNPLINVGDVSRSEDNKYRGVRLNLSEHFPYRYILCPEGNDVASNLKWVMSSNSLAVMPKPKYETWFMEGTLIPNFHYVEVNDDFSNLEEVMDYYSSHLDEAQTIIDNAHRYVAQFRNKERENLLNLLVLEKYFKMTGQIK